LWAWGMGHPTPEIILENVLAFYSGLHDRFAITADGTLLTWARDWDRIWEWETEIGELVSTLNVYPIEIMDGVSTMYFADDIFFVLKHDGSLWGWNLEPWVSLDVENTEPWLIMEDVAVFQTAGSSFFAIRSNGELWAWGDNGSGQLGDGTRINRDEPVFVMDGVYSIKVQGGSVYANRSDGMLWTWGWNAQGQLGDGTSISRNMPMRIGVEHVVDIVVAHEYVFAIDADGTLQFWEHEHTPTWLMDDVIYVRPHGWDQRYFILQADGSLWEFGNGLQDSELLMANVAKFHMSGSDYNAILKNGEILAWGQNWHGRFGVAGPVEVDDAVTLEFTR